MKPSPAPYYRHRFPAEIISHAAWLYHVFSLNLRDIELLLAERGVVISYETVRLSQCRSDGSASLSVQTFAQQWHHASAAIHGALETSCPFPARATG
jgi:hypothetical protein